MCTLKKRISFPANVLWKPFRALRNQSVKFIFWLRGWGNTDPGNTLILLSGLEKLMPVSHNSFNLPCSSPYFPSRHFSTWSYRDSDLTECKLVTPGFIYLHRILDEMHGAVIQNFLLVSPSTKENKTRGLVRSHWVIMRS